VEYTDNSINIYTFDYQVNMKIILLSKPVRFRNIKLLIDKKLMETRENKIYICTYTYYLMYASLHKNKVSFMSI